MLNGHQSQTDRLFSEFLLRIQNGTWAASQTIPSERQLMVEFVVSRVALREALSRLRGLGVLEVSHGKRARVSSLDIGLLGRVFPLLVPAGNLQETYVHVFSVRLALESQTAYLAALNRTEANLLKIQNLMIQLQTISRITSEELIQTDLAYHIEIARATQNPIFPLLLESLSGFFVRAARLSCGEDPERTKITNYFHFSIFKAIRDKDAEHARVEMQSHLRSSMDSLLKSSP